MLDNGKPFTISFNALTEYADLNCSFRLPMVWCAYKPDEVYVRYEEISFDVTIPGNGMVAAYRNGAMTLLAENLSAGTHHITYVLNGKTFDYIGVFSTKGGDNIITITNIVMK